MVGAIVLSPTDAVSQKPVVGSAQRVVVARARIHVTQPYSIVSSTSALTLQAMEPTNFKTVCQTSLLHIYYREQPRSTRIVVAYPRPAFSAAKRTNYAPISFDQQVQVSRGATHCTETGKIEIPRSMVMEALSW